MRTVRQSGEGEGVCVVPRPCSGAACAPLKQWATGNRTANRLWPSSTAGQQELEPSPFGDCDCFTPLRGVLPQLWALWELLLLGQPLMVVAPTPGEQSVV